MEGAGLLACCPARLLQGSTWQHPAPADTQHCPRPPSTYFLYFVVAVRLLARSQDVDHPPLLVPPRAPHALDGSRGRGGGVVAHNQVHLRCGWVGGMSCALGVGCSVLSGVKRSLAAAAWRAAQQQARYQPGPHTHAPAHPPSVRSPVRPHLRDVQPLLSNAGGHQAVEGARPTIAWQTWVGGVSGASWGAAAQETA